MAPSKGTRADQARAQCRECHRLARVTYPAQVMPYHKPSNHARLACPGTGQYLGTLEFLYPDMDIPGTDQL